MNTVKFYKGKEMHKVKISQPSAAHLAKGWPIVPTLNMASRVMISSGFSRKKGTE